MSFFNREGLEETARRNKSRPLVGFQEATEVAWENQWKLHSSISANQALYDEYEIFRTEINDLTGTRIPFNPFPDADGGFEPHILPNENPTNFGSIPRTVVEIPGLARQGLPTAEREAEFFRQVKALREKFPGLADRSAESIRAKIGKDRDRQREQFADTDERTQDLASVGSFVGSMSAVIADPLVFPTLALGAPWSSGVLRGALIDAGIGAASETVVQGLVQTGRQQFGEDIDVTEALTNIGFAGVGGFALSGLLRGGVKGTRALLDRYRKIPEEFKTPEREAAAKYLTRKTELEDANPFPDNARGKAVHNNELDATLARLTQTDTAVGRTLADVTPRVDRSQFGDLFPDEVPKEILEIAQRSNRALFRRTDSLSNKVARKTQQLETEQAKIFQPSQAEVRATRRLTEARRALAETTDPRKAKRLRGAIKKLEEAPAASKKLTKKEVAASKRSKNKATKLQRELDELENELASSSTQTARAVRDVEIQKIDIKESAIKTAIGAGRDPVSTALRRVATVGSRVAREFLDVPPGPSRDLANPVAPSASRLTTPDAKLDQKAADDLLEAEIRAAIEENPDARFSTVNEEGEVVTISGEKLLEDLAEDETLLREINSCIAGILTP